MTATGKPITLITGASAGIGAALADVFADNGHALVLVARRAPQLKTLADTKDIKILMLTSKSQDSDRFWGIKQGADGYITKPYADEELITHVDRLL